MDENIFFALVLKVNSSCIESRVRDLWVIAALCSSNYMHIFIS